VTLFANKSFTLFQRCRSLPAKQAGHRISALQKNTRDREHPMVQRDTASPSG
jgi:hypothetical protein